MIRVGVIGLGMMGNTHLDVYAKRSDARVVAISDINPDRLTGRVKAGGNIEGQAKGAFDYNAVRQHPEGKLLIRDKEVDLVDICLPTPLHMEYAKLALKAGKHVLSEKPCARTAKEARRLAGFAQNSDKMIMIAQCMRFWPGWTWLKDAVATRRYGKVFAAQFRRVANHPGGAFYTDGGQCGGAILDLHVHDTDFVNYLFGMPKSVSSKGYSKLTGAIDHVVTTYEYDDVPLVVAEGGWVMAEGFGFRMEYTANFERATAVFNLADANPLTLYEPGLPPTPVQLAPGMGYEHEIDYFLNCIKTGQKPTVVTVESAADSVRIVEAEAKSIKAGRPVKLS